MGSSGCVSYLFTSRGEIVIEKGENFDSDKAMELAINLNAVDCIDEEVFTVITEPNASSVNEVVTAFESEGYTILSSGVEMVASNYIKLGDSQRETFNKMIDKLNESDDVIDIIHNLEEEDDE